MINKNNFVGLFAFFLIVSCSMEETTNKDQSVNSLQHAIMNLWHVNLVLKCLQIT